MQAHARLDSGTFAQVFHHLPVALWQGDHSAIALRLDALRCQGISDLTLHHAQNPDFLPAALRSMRVETWNRRAAALFAAQSAASGIEQTLTENPVLFQRLVEALFQGKADYKEDILLPGTKGNIVPASFTITFLPPSAGHHHHVICIGETGADAIIGAPALPDDHRYRDLFRNVPVPLVHLDMGGVFRFLARLRQQHGDRLIDYVASERDFPVAFAREIRLREANAAAAALFGLSSPEDFPASVTHAWSLSPETLRRSCLARIAGVSGHVEETRIRTFDGRVVDVIFSITFTPSASDPETNIVAFVDVSDRVRAEAALQSLQADFAHASRLSLMGELAGSIAHEINQPLTGIIATAQMVQRCVRQPHLPLREIAELAADIVDDGQRAAAIIANIRGMIEKRETARMKTGVLTMLQSACGFLRKEILSSGVSLSIDADHRGPDVMVDPVQIQQVIVNLMINALQAMAAAGSAERWLKIACRKAGSSQILVTIADSGPGIAPGLIDRLFESFMTTKSQGLGIGLSICRNIVESHGGRLTATNTPHGAEFSFTLPIADEQMPEWS